MQQFESDFPSISLGSISHLSHASSTKSLTGHTGNKFALHDISYDDEIDGQFSSMERRARSPARKTAHFQDQSLPRNKSDATIRKVPRERSVPRAATLERMNKLRSRSEHSLNVDIPDERATRSPQKATRFEKRSSKPVVPRLDLSFTKSRDKNKTKSKLQKDPDEDFGIYGNSDSDSDVDAPQTQERYISLEMPDSSQLTQTLKRVGVETQDNDKSERIQRRDSVTDSGITHTQTGTDASALSLNTLGLSPAINVTSTEPTDTNQPQNTPNELLFSKSLPDLNYHPSGDLELTQNNIDAIVNSTLSEEEKLDLMAAMCENKDISDSKLSDKAHELPYRFSPNTTEYVSEAQLDVRSQTKQRQSPLTSQDGSKSNQGSKYNGLPTESSQTQIPRSFQTATTKQTTPVIEEPRSSKPSSESSHDDQSYTRKKKQEYGIDVAAWVNKYGYDADSIEAESVGLGSVEINSNDGMEGYVEKLKAIHHER